MINSGFLTIFPLPDYLVCDAQITKLILKKLAVCKIFIKKFMNNLHLNTNNNADELLVQPEEDILWIAEEYFT